MKNKRTEDIIIYQRKPSTVYFSTYGNMAFSYCKQTPLLVFLLSLPNFSTFLTELVFWGSFKRVQ